MASATATYQLRATEHGVLHHVVREHLETFPAAAARAGWGGGRLPAFVEQEFQDFLTCGVPAHGFARVRCDTCAFERPAPFSCCLETDTMKSWVPRACRLRALAKDALLISSCQKARR